MSGKEPTRIFGWNPTRAQVVLTLVLGAVSLLGAAWTFAYVVGGWMTKTADYNFHDRIDKAVAPPRGQIYRAVEDQIAAHAEEVEDELVEIKDQIETMKRWQVRQDVMMTEVHATVTGRPPPPPIE